MLKSLQISGFRCFRELRVEPLSRVNLFVGTNNSGKTSILEAAELLATGSLLTLWRSPSRRGEQILDSRPSFLLRSQEIDPSHLFHGRTLRPGAAFRLGDSVSGLEVRCEVVEWGETSLVESGKVREIIPTSKPPVRLEELIPSLGLAFFSDRKRRESRAVPLSPFNGLPLDTRWARTFAWPSSQIPSVSFLATELTEPQPELPPLWDSVALTQQEAEVTETLRLVEPSIERIAFLGENRRLIPNFFLRFVGSELRIPLGSVGDGLKRLLRLALHLQSAKEGVLLVDQIDTGLHYTVLAKMWRLVITTAKRLDLQVLATTQSLDCVRALATVYESDPELTAEVTLHRVERDQPQTVFYRPEEISVAAEQRIEVR